MTRIFTLSLCLLVSCTETKPTASDLHAALTAKDHERVHHLLLQNASLVNARDKYGYTSLHNSLSYDDDASIRMGKLLLEAGADVNLPDPGGFTVVDYNADNPVVIKILLQHHVTEENLNGALLTLLRMTESHDRNLCIAMIRTAGGGRAPPLLPRTRKISTVMLNGEKHLFYEPIHQARNSMSSPIYVYVLTRDLHCLRRGWLYGEDLPMIYWIVEVLEDSGQDARPADSRWHLAILYFGDDQNLFPGFNRGMIRQFGWLRFIRWPGQPLPPKSAFIAGADPSKEWNGVLSNAELEALTLRIVNVP